jgi:hypothetical protein
MSRYKTFFETRKNYYYSNQENGKPIYEKSWLDSFVIGDVYILGFGFNFAEYDLWWLLNRKKRERARHGKVYFYEAYDDNEIPAKIALLKAYDVETCNLGIKKCETGEFANFYQLALDDIKNKMEKRRKEV